MSFYVVVEQFLTLREQATDEWHAMKAVTTGTNLLLSLRELSSIAELAESAPLNRSLRRFVKSLPEPQLHALLALIYAGRDGRSDAVAYWRTSIRDRVVSRSAAVETILEKELAPDYIRAAIHALPAGLDLDMLPSLIDSPA